MILLFEAFCEAFLGKMIEEIRNAHLEIRGAKPQEKKHFFVKNK